jgi:hypothetical protein
VELTFHGISGRDYARDVAFKSQFAQFKTVASNICALQGWTLADLKARFSNELWDYLVFNDREAQ